MAETTDTYQFEGDEITGLTAQIPGTKLDIEESWPRGTIVQLSLAVRVRSVRIEEDRKGNLSRHHVFAIETAVVDSAETPAQRRAQFEAAEAKLAAQQAKAQAKQQPVIEEQPGPDDVVAQVVEAEADWSDVDAQDAEKRGAAPVETDEQQFEDASF